MAAKILIALCVLVTIAAAVPAGGAGGGWAGPPWAGAGGVNPWIPPWVAAASWYPKWTPCTTLGPSCLDCNTLIACTKVGQLQKACTDPAKPHCNLGQCSATPSDECAVPVVPAAAV